MTRTERGNPTEQAIEMIEDACQDWTGADWRHEATGEAAGDGEPVYCEGDVPGCGRCEAAESDARYAALLGRDAIAALRRGDWSAARRRVSEAAELEAEYGDAPVWGPVVDALEDLVVAEYAANDLVDVKDHVAGRAVDLSNVVVSVCGDGSAAVSAPLDLLDDEEVEDLEALARARWGVGR